MQALPPPSPPVVIVESATTHQPTIFLGFMGVGDDQSKVALERAAADRGFPTQHASNDKNQDEVMVVFPPGSDSRRALSFYEDALAGKFGSLALEVVVAPASAAADGHLDMENEVTAEQPNTILVPGS